MSETKHTQLPWKISPRQIDSSPYQIFNEKDVEIAATICIPSDGIAKGIAEAKAKAEGRNP